MNPYTGLKGDDALLNPLEAEEAGHEVFKTWPLNPPDATLAGIQFKDYKWDQYPGEVYYTVLRSEGRNANRQQVTFSYGLPTGQALYGMNGELTLKGFTVNGEFVANPQNFIFPVGSNAGKRHSKRQLGIFRQRHQGHQVV